MNLRDLEYLVAVADAGNFRRAAAACEVSQPTLSTQIKRLEAELGVVLLDRSAAPLALTAVGEKVVARARRILDEAAGIRSEAELAHDAEGGSLRLGLFPTVGPYLFPHVISGVRERFPSLKLMISEEKSADLLALLDAGKLDAVVLAEPVVGAGLHVEPLFKEEFLLAAPQGHSVVSMQGPVPPSVLEGTELLCLTAGHCLADQVSEWIAKFGGSRRGDFRASSLEAMRSMVSAGQAVTLLPALTVVPPVAPAAGVALRRFASDIPHRDIALVWRTGSPQAGLLKKLGRALVPTNIPDGLVQPSEVLAVATQPA